jgi:autotransporter-associated beta strand protein
MKKIYLKTIVVLAFLLTVSSSALAQVVWQSGTVYTLTSNITDNVIIKDIHGYLNWVFLNIPAGNSVVISGNITQTTGWYVGICKQGAGELILTGNNTWGGTGDIAYNRVDEGTLVIGNNGNTGNLPNIPVVIAAGAYLTFNHSNNYVFSSVISGQGGVKQYGGAELFFIGNNTYSGNTTIGNGTLYIGNYWNTGAVVGNIIVDQGEVLFARSDDYTYNGIISGSGNVRKVCSTSTLTLGGVNTYTGNTYIDGTLELVGSGSINNSYSVTLGHGTFEVAKLIIPVPPVRTIKRLYSTRSNAVVQGYLFIGTDGENDGGGSYAGIFSGTVHKKGKGELILTSTCTNSGGGPISVFEGTITFSNLSNIAPSIFYLAGGTLKWAFGNTADISGYLKCWRPNTTIDIGSNNVIFAHDFTDALEYNNSIIKAGSGWLTLQHNQEYPCKTTISDGTLSLRGSIKGDIINNSYLEFYNSSHLEYSGVISGSGSVSKIGGANLTFTGNNTYTGNTFIEGGKLYISGTTGAVAGNILNNSELHFNRSNAYTYNGVISGQGKVYQDATNAASVLTLGGGNNYIGATYISGPLALSATGSIQYSSSVTLENTSNAKLDITAGSKTIKELNSTNANAVVALGTEILTIGTSGGTDGGGDYAGKITGTGVYAIGKYGSGKLILTGTNTYTGATVIHEGTLQLGNGGTTGSIAGNITNGSALIFNYSNNPTFSKEISGIGTVTKLGSGWLTFEGNNTYTGTTTISAGTLQIDGNIVGNIVNNGNVVFNFNVDKTYSGVISGSGTVNKKGDATLTLNNTTHTATGNLVVQAGTLKFLGSWAGSFTKNAAATLDILGNATVGGSLTLNGGSGGVFMNLTATPPSKITVTGAVSTTATTTLNITTAAVTDYVLIQAASGITSISPYTLNMPGMLATLSVNSPTKLLLTATVEDLIAPVPGAAGVINGTVAAESVNVNWTYATDNQTPQNQLRYYVYRSLSNNINTVANCEANGTLLNSGGTVNINSLNATELTPNTTYYFNVVVADLANNKAAYVSKAFTTDKATLAGSVGISGNAVFGEILTAVTTELSSTPPISNLGMLSYQWKRDGIDIGGNNVTYTLMQGDITHTFTVTVTAVNCNGSVTSAATEPVQKAEQTAPPAPSAANITSTSITLNTITDCEYRMDDGEWKTSPIFTNLTPNTTYSFAARKAETETHYASPASESANITTEQGTDEPAILHVKISPKKVTVLLGQTQQFTATVSATGGADESVTWSIAGHVSMLTSISATGLLTVGSNEIAETITVKVVSVFDPTKSDEATVTTKNTGVESITNYDLRVYPNPTTGELRIEMGDMRYETGDMRYEIYDVCGRRMEIPRFARNDVEWQPQADGVVINIAHLPAGIYFLKIQTEQGVVVRKIIKN